MSTSKVDEIEKKIEQLKAQKQAILARTREQERKARTKRLIEIGAIVEKNLGISSTIEASLLCHFFNSAPQNKDMLMKFISANLPKDPLSE
jgi:flagellar biosynthesis GTPase FlhF